MKKIRENLFIQFLSFILLLLLIVTTVFTMNQYNAKKITRNNTLQLNENVLTQLIGKMDEMFISMQNLMSSVAYNPVVYAYYKEEEKRPLMQDDLKDVLINTLITDDYISGIELYNMEGNKLLGVGKKYTSTVSPEDINTIVYSEQILSDDGDNVKYAIYYPIYDLKNVQYFTKLGICVFYLSVENITDFLNEVRITDHTYLYVIDKELNLLAQNSIAKKDQDFLQNLEKIKDRYYVSEMKIDRNGWTIISYVPITELLQGLDFLNKEMKMLYIFSIGILVLLVYFCYNAVINPLHQIDLFVKRNSTHTDERMDYKSRNEIGTLARNLNRMLDERDTMNREIQDSQKKIYETQLAKKQMEILAYRNQINPHFLYNTLECIRAMAMYQGCENVSELTVALSNVLRYAVKGENIVCIKDELNYIQEYSKIIECRFSKIRIELEIDNTLLEKKMVRLILQPLVENAVFHGLEPMINGGKVWIKIYKVNGKTKREWIYLSVEDNGFGMNGQRLQEIYNSMRDDEIGKENGSQSIGLVNIYQRLKLTYDDNMELFITSERGKGTKVVIGFAETV